MAIGGVDTQTGNQLAALRNTQPSRAEELRAQQDARESQEARAGAQDTSETENRESRFGTAETAADRTGFSSPASTLDSQSLTALIQATQQQDTAGLPTDQTDGEAEASNEARQQQVASGNSTNSLAPGTTAGVADGSTDTRGVSLLV